jgi:hypothetical protein
MNSALARLHRLCYVRVIIDDHADYIGGEREGERERGGGRGWREREREGEGERGRERE